MIGHIEIWTGLAGDMMVGALLDAGWPEDRLRQIAGALGIPGVEVVVERRKHGGLTGLGIRVTDPHPSGHRGVREIESILLAAGLPDAVSAGALRVLHRLADVEARVHGIPPEQVHFHELGAADSIVDIVATVAALHDLGVDRLTASPVPISGGIISMDHGLVPAPAPATALLLEGWPVRPEGSPGEWVTPTAAALLSVLAQPAEGIPALRVCRVGYGAGTRSHPVLPNLVRLWLGTARGSSVSRRVVVLETQVDDMDPRILAEVTRDLAEAGALDVFQTPVFMKKGRLGSLLTVIAAPGTERGLATRILGATTTLGVRMREEDRLERERWFETLQTELGAVRIKWSAGPEGARPEPEFEDLAQLARDRGVTVQEIASWIRRILPAAPKEPEGPGQAQSDR